jgi:hypothetical protein
VGQGEARDDGVFCMEFESLDDRIAGPSSGKNLHFVGNFTLDGVGEDA